jgi:hypothetical protein
VREDNNVTKRKDREKASHGAIYGLPPSPAQQRCPHVWNNRDG